MTTLKEHISDLSSIDIFFPERGLLQGVNRPPTRLALIGALGLLGGAEQAGRTVAVSGNEIRVLQGTPDPFGPAEIIETLQVDDTLPQDTVWEIRTVPGRDREGHVVALARSVAEAETLMRRDLSGPRGLLLPSCGDAEWENESILFEYREQIGVNPRSHGRETRRYRLTRLRIGELL